MTCSPSPTCLPLLSRSVARTRPSTGAADAGLVIGKRAVVSADQLRPFFENQRQRRLPLHGRGRRILFRRRRKAAHPARGRVRHIARTELTPAGIKAISRGLSPAIPPELINVQAVRPRRGSQRVAGTPAGVLGQKATRTGVSLRLQPLANRWHPCRGARTRGLENRGRRCGNSRPMPVHPAPRCGTDAFPSPQALAPPPLPLYSGERAGVRGAIMPRARILQVLRRGYPPSAQPLSPEAGARGGKGGCPGAKLTNW